mmetsp:Transcript_36492/g.51586  ORF Transcript_36492/g.51586 Transcript_36492/m.51586 type:complete len:160 (+) Transcript_36492:136-615(+)|eukprot:CAMPEP_0202474938 /NCGR_PEP_ID=MMETSP1360-20130828/92643_1 /ASSEMBLY_ACC=CAM_ASM_000848 /TAXON_ID=515479 /ORGANISM="Licmophora paradoxa, Strain CCMP2313" /LENGTH=159 /DNA_ID=CAMNT_0049102083 /DNA_START=136 /DNA_END=615 /DNA_ORIENTATION=-
MTELSSKPPIDLTPKQSVTGFALFQCCIPKQKEEEEEPKPNDTHTAREMPYISRSKLECIPEIDSEDGEEKNIEENEENKKGQKVVTVSDPLAVQQNLIMFWKLLLSILMLKFQTQTNRKAITATAHSSTTTKDQALKGKLSNDDDDDDEIEVPDMTEE